MTLCYHRHRTIRRPDDFSGDTVIRCDDCGAAIRIEWNVPVDTLPALPDLVPMPVDDDKPASTSELPLAAYEIRDENDGFVRRGSTSVYADGSWQVPLLDDLDPGTYRVLVELVPGEWTQQEFTVQPNQRNRVVP